MKITYRRRGAPYSRPLEQMYSITEASQEVGVARQTMSRWIKTGRISPVHRFSQTCVRVPVSSVNRYLKRTGRSPEIPPPTKGKPTGFRRPTEKNRLHATAKRPGYLAFADRESITLYMNTKNKKSQPEASAPGNPSTITGQNSQENAVAHAIALLSIYSPYIPRHFRESKPVWWLLDADDQRACKVSSLISPNFDLRKAAKTAGPEKRVLTMQLTDLSKLNAYLRTEGQIELPPPPLGEGYIAVCCAGALVVRRSDVTPLNALCL